MIFEFGAFYLLRIKCEFDSRRGHHLFMIYWLEIISFFIVKGGVTMSVFKIEKSKDYTIISNYHLRDRNLSYKAKGLLSFMLSLPDDWDYSLAGLCSISKESRDGIRAILNELKEHHYLEIEKVRGEKGYFEYNYLIYEKPHFIELENDKKN